MGLARNVICPANLAVILKQPPRFEIRASNGRFFFSTREPQEVSFKYVIAPVALYEAVAP